MRKTIRLFVCILPYLVVAGCGRWNQNLWFDRMRAVMNRYQEQYEAKCAEIAEIYPQVGYDSPQFIALMAELKDIEKQSMKSAEKLSDQSSRHYRKMNVSDQLGFRLAYQHVIEEYVAERNKWIGYPNYTIENNREQSYNMVIRTLVLCYQRMFNEAYTGR